MDTIKPDGPVRGVERIWSAGSTRGNATSTALRRVRRCSSTRSIGHPSEADTRHCTPLLRRRSTKSMEIDAVLPQERRRSSTNRNQEGKEEHEDEKIYSKKGPSETASGRRQLLRSASSSRSTSWANMSISSLASAEGSFNDCQANPFVTGSRIRKHNRSGSGSSVFETMEYAGSKGGVSIPCGGVVLP